MPNIDLALVISNPGADREKIVATLLRCGVHSICCSKFSEACTLLPQDHFRLVVCSDQVPGGGVPMVLDGLRRAGVNTPLVAISHTRKWDSNLEALISGAFSFIECPVVPGDAEKVLRAALVASVQERETASKAA